MSGNKPRNVRQLNNVSITWVKEPGKGAQTLVHGAYCRDGKQIPLRGMPADQVERLLEWKMGDPRVRNALSASSLAGDGEDRKLAPRVERTEDQRPR